MSGDGPEPFEELADLVGLIARSARWLARVQKPGADAACLQSIADDIDAIRRRLLVEGKRRARPSEARSN